MTGQPDWGTLLIEYEGPRVRSCVVVSVYHFRCGRRRASTRTPSSASPSTSSDTVTGEAPRDGPLLAERRRRHQSYQINALVAAGLAQAFAPGRSCSIQTLSEKPSPRTLRPTIVALEGAREHNTTSFSPK